MPVSVLAADISFIDLDNSHKFTKFGHGEPSADAMAHIMCGRVGTEAEHPLYVQCGNTLLAGQHQVDDFEPSPQRDISVFEDRSDQNGKAITTSSAALALPMECPARQFIHVFVPATRTANAFRPTASNQILLASIVGREKFFELRDRHLRGEFDLAHRDAPNV